MVVEEDGGGRREEEEEGVMILGGVVCCVWVWCERIAQGGVGGILGGEAGCYLHGVQ